MMSHGTSVSATDAKTCGGTLSQLVAYLDRLLNGIGLR